ncbi:hypothetical protein ACLBWZ_13395 [Brucellaceae bacterium C25G]
MTVLAQNTYGSLSYLKTATEIYNSSSMLSDGILTFAWGHGNRLDAVTQSVAKV